MTSTEEKAPQAAQHRSKPVLVYITVLFMVAFLMMGLSFASQRRSNEEAIGDLETSVHTTLKDLQAQQAQLPELQEEIVDLKKQLAESQQTNEKISAALGDAARMVQEAADAQEAAEKRLHAMEQFYVLQQWYLSGDQDACREQIEAMEETGLADLLPAEPYPHDNGTAPAPFSQFMEIKEAVLPADADTAAE